MFDALRSLIGDHVNFVFVGEAGSGKSEVSLNFARYLVDLGDKPVHYFDMDMTKPLFRSRDVVAEIEALGVIFHYEEQFMDAPVQVGGVNRLLRDPGCYVILDIGGDYIGARSIGGYAPQINKDQTIVYYVLNAYRPWSNDIDHIDGTLGKILGVSHIELGKLHMVNNPNNGLTTTEQEFVEGSRKMSEMVTPYIAVDFACVREELYGAVRDQSDVPVMPVHLYLTYEWLKFEPISPGGPPLPGKG
ncbi:MAG: ATP-binding protein [Clostridiales bacterium]|nr:ATP-binding protein [Clostridiales bacterium]